VTDSYLQATLLPWLHLRTKVEFADYYFAHMSEVLPCLPDDLRPTVGAIGSGFVELDGRATDPVVAWPFREGAVPTFMPRPTSEVADRARLLFLAALCATDYFTLTNPVNATHFDVVGQNFVPRSEHVSFWARRRDGEVMMGGTRLDEVRVSRPIAAFPAECPALDPQLLDALSLTLGSADPELKRIATSSDGLRRGNRLELADSVAEDLFWCVTALEQLLVDDKGGGKAKQLADKVASRTGQHGRWGHQLLLRAWAMEAYDARSEVHGKPAKTARWTKWVHTLIATEAYSLIVRDIFVRRPDVPFALTLRDERRLEAFPRQVAALTQRRVSAGGHGATALWHAADKAAKSAALQQRVVDYLRRSDQEDNA
jgi:hypothetical protein